MYISLRSKVVKMSSITMRARAARAGLGTEIGSQLK